VRSYDVKVSQLAFDKNLGIPQRIGDSIFEQFSSSQARFEILDTAVLPGAVRIDIGSLGPNRRDPVPHNLTHKLRAIVGADLAKNAWQDEQIRQHVDYIRWY